MKLKNLRKKRTDLSSLKDQKCLYESGPLHVLLNNAGLINKKRKETIDGFEDFAINHLAYFYLTYLLLDSI